MRETDHIEPNLIPCISCGRCLTVCPVKIGIPGSFEAMNHLTRTGDLAASLEIERALVTDKGYKGAGGCIVCGRCEKHCPVHIKIRDQLLEVSKSLGK